MSDENLDESKEEVQPKAVVEEPTPTISPADTNPETIPEVNLAEVNSVEGIVYYLEKTDEVEVRKIQSNVILDLYNTIYSSSYPLATTVSDQDGKFYFDISNAETFPEGMYKVYAGKGEEYTGDIKIRIRRDVKLPVLPVFLNRQEISRTTALIFTSLAVLIMAGVLFASFYFHKNYPKGMYKNLENLAQIAENQANEYTNASFDTTMKMCTGSEGPIKICNEFTFYPTLNLIDSMSSSFGSNISKKEYQAIHGYVDLSLKTKHLSVVKENATGLKDYIKELESDYKVWDEMPFKFVEIYIWAFIAVLVRIILYNGRHIYKDTFRKWAFAQQISFMLCVPVIALIIVMVFSLLNFQITSSAFTLDLDLSNIYLNIVIAALIGFVPWKSWHYLISLSDGLFKILPGFPKSKLSGGADV